MGTKMAKSQNLEIFPGLEQKTMVSNIQFLIILKLSLNISFCINDSLLCIFTVSKKDSTIKERILTVKIEIWNPFPDWSKIGA
jgi:hypothetical protein